MNVGRLSGFRHMAAIALAGWYLMVPPPKATRAGGKGLDFDAPVSAWSTLHAFDSEQECKNARDSALMIAPAHKLDTMPLNDSKIIIGTLQNARCIPSNDPNLKAKENHEDE